MVSLTLDPIGGTVTTAGTLTGSIPSGWFPTDAQGFVNYMHVLNISGQGVGDYAGNIFLQSGIISIAPNYGSFLVGGVNQGLQYSTNIVYYSMSA